MILVELLTITFHSNQYYIDFPGNYDSCTCKERLVLPFLLLVNKTLSRKLKIEQRERTKTRVSSIDYLLMRY
jgi:hypothetical protein